MSRQSQTIDPCRPFMNSCILRCKMAKHQSRMTFSWGSWILTWTLTSSLVWRPSHCHGWPDFLSSDNTGQQMQQPSQPLSSSYSPNYSPGSSSLPLITSTTPINQKFSDIQPEWGTLTPVPSRSRQCWLRWPAYPCPYQHGATPQAATCTPDSRNERPNVYNPILRTRHNGPLSFSILPLPSYQPRTLLPPRYWSCHQRNIGSRHTEV